VRSQLNGYLGQGIGSARLGRLSSSAFMDNLSLYQTAHMNYPYTLPPLEYGYDALEPHIDSLTMSLHHDKHHQTYIDNANKTVAKYPELQEKSLVDLVAHVDELPGTVRAAIQSNGGGHVNHSLFWGYLVPGGATEPAGKLAQAIKKTFDGFGKFKEQFDSAAKDRLGSGWAWLSVTSAGDLEVSSTANQDSPLSNGCLPILGLDVWEHAYYLKYHNKRPDYIIDWWHVVNWKRAQERFESITG
jgi:Fe-Mn family superoxide dismutase